MTSRKALNLIVALVLFAAVSAMLYYFPCPSDSQYFFIRVLISLAAGAFSAILLGFITIQSTRNKNSLKAGGGFAIAVLSFIYTPKLTGAQDRCNSVSGYTIFLRDTNGATIPDLSGTLLITIGTDPREREINNRSIDFNDLPSAFLKDTVVIELKTKGWWFANTHSRTISTVLSGTKTTLKLIKDETQCCISGIILDSDGDAPIKDADVSVADTIIKTNQLGKFDLNIPEARRKEKQVVTISAPGFDNYTKEVSSEIKDRHTFYLTKKKK